MTASWAPAMAGRLARGLPRLSSTAVSSAATASAKSRPTQASDQFGTNVPAPGYFEERGDEFFVSSMRNTLRLPTYSRVDLRANRTFNWSRKRLTLFAEVINLFNRDNVRFNPPGVNTATGRVSNLFESLIPIVPSAGILIEF